jgi:hypothetical protein
MGRRIGWGVAASLAGAAMLAAPAMARAADPAYIALGAGAYDFLHDNLAAQIRGEYRFAHGFFFLKPLVGALATSDSSIYAYGGFRVELKLGQHFVLMPVATVGYFSKGDGKDLGSPVEFKTGVELDYQFDNASRLGIAFDHISNAGLTRRNPGTESLLVVYSLPFGGP